MKKIFILFMSVVISFSSLVSFAEESDVTFKVVNDLGDYKIIAHEYAVPWHGVVYTYKDYGVINKDGKIVVEQKYSHIKPPSDGRAAFKTVDGNIGFFDENWNVVIEPKYFSNGPEIYFSEGLAAVGKRNSDRYIVWGYIDRDGNEVIDFIYDYAEAFKNEIAVVGISECAYFNTQYKYGKIR
mgnify:CR=1 FL=1